MWFNLCRKMYAEMNLLKLINAFEVFLQFICKKPFIDWLKYDLILVVSL